MVWENVTKFLIYAGIMVYVTYDIFAFEVVPNGYATESTTIGTWLSRYLWVVFLVFLLVGHLFASGPTVTWKMVVAALGAFFLGFFCTRA